MSEILSFPNEAERLWVNGNKKIEEQEFLTAKRLFEQLYQLEPTFRHCQRLVETLQNLGEFTKALELAEDYLEDFLNNPTSFEMYLRLLMLDGQYLAVHSWLQQTSLPLNELRQDLEKLEFAQEVIGTNEQVVKKQQLQQWESSGYPVPQKDWNEWLKNSSFSNFLRMCQEFLPIAQNPFIIPKLVEELVKIGADDEVMIHGKIVHLSELVLLEKTATLQEVYKLLKKKALKDVQLEEMLIAEIQAHFALMYPFLPDESDVALWLESYLLEYKSLFGDETAAEQLQNYERIQLKKQELREIYQKLL